MSGILDRIEDNKHQYDTRDLYQKEKELLQAQKNKKEEFKAPSLDTKVVNLGKFGNKNKNRKKILEGNEVKPAPPENVPLSEKLEDNKKEEESNTVQKSKES